MPNGRPGDHPYTDIVAHHGKVFGAPIDDLVREIHDRGTGSQRDAVSKLVAEHEPGYGNTSNPALVEATLREILAEIKGG